MKRKHHIITLAAVVLAMAAFMAYRYFFRAGPQEVWDLVPARSLAVLETPHLFGTWDELARSPIWQSLQTVPDYEALSRSMAYLDSITSGLSVNQRRSRVLLALQTIGADKLDVLLVVDLKKAEMKNSGRSSTALPKIEIWNSTPEIFKNTSSPKSRRSGMGNCSLVFFWTIFL
ncbi:MAG: hypothetical protein HC842_07675 [Cytophagales bacterium]|nr:hypothetical protein [Cytophagales bacterium]